MGASRAADAVLALEAADGAEPMAERTLRAVAHAGAWPRLYESETFWLDQRRLAELFGVDVRTVSYHRIEVYASGELAPEATLRKTWRVQREGNRAVRREIEFYNLDAIISVSYRVTSAQAAQFRMRGGIGTEPGHL